MCILSKVCLFLSFFYLGKSCAEKCNQLCIEQKAGVWSYSCKGKELRSGWRWGGGHFTFTSISQEEGEKNLRINPQNRFRLKVADSKLFLFAIRQLSSNVWDDTASILCIDYQQETLSMLTMCATYKSPCCCLLFSTSSLSPPKRGVELTWKRAI